MSNRFAIDKKIAANNLRFHYRDWGGKGWPLILLHDVGSTGHIWDLVAPLLVEDFRVIALDLRGHGDNSHPLDDLTLAAMSDDIIKIAADLDMPHPLLVGHGFGAWLGMYIAAEIEDLPGGLVMVNGGLVDLKEVPAKEAASLYGPPTLDGVTLDAFREELVAEAPQGLISPAIEAALLASYTIDEEEILTPRLSRNGWMKLLREMASHPPAGFYSRIACPVLILAARHAEGNSMATTEAVARAEASIEDVETIWLEEATHNAPLQHPHRVAEAIRAFLRQHM